MDFDSVYKTMLLNRGGNVINSDIRNSKDSINRKFKNDPSYKLGVLKKKDKLNEELDLDTRLVNNDNNPLEKKIFVRPDTDIGIGDYIIYTNITYLVLAVENNLITPRADSTKCNQLLKWMYKGNLYDTQAIVTNQTKYTLGISTIVAGITEGDSRYVITLPYNYKTQNIKVGQRFIFNANAWKVTQTDFVSDVGLLSILLGQDSINNEIDDVDNEIAGAYANKHTYTYNMPTSFEVSKDNTTTLVYSIKDETGKEFDYSLVTVKNTSNLIQVDNNKGVISIKGLDIGTGSIALSVPSGETSKDFTISFEVKSVVADKIDYTITSSGGYDFKVKMGSLLTINKMINGTVDNTLQIDYKVPTNIQALITKGSLSIVPKSDTSVYVRNINVSVLTSFVIEFYDRTTNQKVIDSPTISLKGMG